MMGHLPVGVDFSRHTISMLDVLGNHLDGYIRLSWGGRGESVDRFDFGPIHTSKTSFSQKGLDAELVLRRVESWHNGIRGQGSSGGVVGEEDGRW